MNATDAIIFMIVHIGVTRHARFVHTYRHALKEKQSSPMNITRIF
jgi:hypothetical protein